MGTFTVRGVTLSTGLIKASFTTAITNNIINSLIFNDDDSSSFTRTPGGVGNRQSWTFSAWIKRGNIDGFSGSNIFSADRGSFFSDTIRLGTGDDGDYIHMSFNDGGSGSLRTDALYRDPSAWMHLVVSIDTAQATASNRVKIYVNGDQITDFSTETYPSQFYDTAMNNTVVHNIGAFRVTPIQFFDGYMAEINFLDGQQLDASNFGEVDSNGQWIAKNTSGLTFGGNSFHLDFSDSGDLGNDISGLNNDWTPNNFASDDVVTDTPSNNYCVMNPLTNTGSYATISNGNLTVARASAVTNSNLCKSTFVIKSTPIYFEDTWTFSGSGVTYFTIAPVSLGLSHDQNAFVTGTVNYNMGSGQVYKDGVLSTTMTTQSSGSTIGIAFDPTSGSIWFRKSDGDWQSGDPESDSSPTISGLDTGIEYELVISGSNNAGSASHILNFGQKDFAYTPPAGYVALSTNNLPTPTISNPSEYFNSVLFTGNSGTAFSVTGVGFSPDLIWGKPRSIADNHRVIDRVRGVSQQLIINSTGAEFTQSQGITSFDGDGFTVGTHNGLNNGTNTYVAWNWKANGSSVANTDGSISSTVSANTTSGFSIVSYTGTGANATIGHGLGVAPSMIIVKRYSDIGAWKIYHDGIGPTQGLEFTSGAAATSSTYWNDTAPSGSVFSVGSAGSVNTLSSNHIAYCFAEVGGFSKFGSYTGNGSANGPFIYCGFRPAYLMIKNASAAATDWMIKDIARDTSNPLTTRIFADLTNGDDVNSINDVIDFTANGFKIKSASGAQTNGSGNTIIFAAFAEQPFKTANAR